jgi:hypothetical protein
MIRTFHASADDRDFRAMTRGSGSLGRNLVFVSLPLSVFLSGLAYLLSRSFVAASIVGGLVLLASVWSNVSFFSDVRRRRNSRSDDRAVEVTEVQASRVLDIEPLGSHGPAWVFFGDGGKALLLVGQWLLAVRSFPSRSFLLYRWADTKKPIRIKSTGKRVKPEHSTVSLRARHHLRDVEVFDATPETLQDDLDRAFGEKVVRRAAARS